MAELNTFGQFLVSLEQVDFFTLLLPFIVSYVLFLFTLRKIDLFDDNGQVSSVIAIAAAFFMAQFIATNPIYQTFFIEYFGRLTIGMIGILGLASVLGLAGWGNVLSSSKPLALIFLAGAGIVFARSGGLEAIVPISEFPSIAGAYTYLFESGLIWLVVLGGVMYWTAPTGNDDGGDDDSTASAVVDAILGENGG